MGPIQVGFNMIRNAFRAQSEAQSTQANVTGAAAISGGGESKLVREARKLVAQRMVSRSASDNPLLDGLTRVGKVNEKPKKQFYRRGKFRPISRFLSEQEEERRE